jgi:aspartyl-tRNA(Asn)/glutamyl-tRNA(Gln) amidotransferase subunit A
MSKHPPRLAGRPLAAARALAETPGASVLIRNIFKKGLRIDVLADLPESLRSDLPASVRPLQAREPRSRPDGALPLPERAFPRPSAAYTRAYLARTTTPSDVAERALLALPELRARRPTQNILAASLPEVTRTDAAASTARYASGSPLGPLDGVPLLIKDEFDVRGMATRLGSQCEPTTPKERDSTVADRLRRAGAILICKTVMTEWGMSPLGVNQSSIMPHNPHNPSRAAGGSSTGSAVGVALGIAPIAAGADGGGSIRTPAALCGVFGIKPTFGRVSRAGFAGGGSMAHAGPIGASTADLALFLNAVAAAIDPLDPSTEWAPPPPKGGFGSSLGAGVRGLRIGVLESEIRDAEAPIASAVESALRALEREGASLETIAIPLSKHAPAIGYLSIGPETLASHREAWTERRGLMNDDLRLTFAALSTISSLEHLDAQRLRQKLREQTAEALRRVDLLALPTLAISAPRYTEEDARTSFSDSAALDGVCRFAFLANVTGLPAATAPVGWDSDGLPIGLQLIGDAWDEATVLGALAHIERTEIAVVRRAEGAFDLVG